MTYQLAWLADVLRANGLNVIELEGWKNRGRADMSVVKGVICHHTGGPLTGNKPSLDLVVHGREDLPGPLSQLFLARDGTFYVVAAGRCNHAGRGLWQGITNGNGQFIGIEAENAGTGKDEWPLVQIAAYSRGVAAILKKIGADDVMAAGHKEYALPKGRKIDPSFDMLAFRERVADDMSGQALGPYVAQTDPAHSMLQKGAQGESVEELQKTLGIKVDGGFGPKTYDAVVAFQKAHGLAPDGKVGPKTWAALLAEK